MGKVEEYNLAEDIVELYSRGESLNEIARIFNKQGFQISRPTIGRWIDANKELIATLVQKNDQLQEKLVSNFLDASQQILFMNNAALKLYNEAEADVDRPSMFRALDQMGKNLILYNQLIGKPESEMDMVRILERLPAEYQEAIKNVHRRRHGPSD